MVEYPSSRSCYTSTPSWGRRARVGFCTIAAMPEGALWWCTHAHRWPMNLAQAFGAASPHKCEYLCTHRRDCVRAGRGGAGVEN